MHHANEQHHPHSSAAAREIAERGTILRVQVGSGVHGTSITGQDDRDEMGLCLEPQQFVTGVSQVPSGSGLIQFDQYEYHSAWERDGGLANRSGAGDLDVIIYSARKWVRLALGGNPTVLLPLFVPDDEVVVATEAGHDLRGNADRVASRRAAARFLGYMTSQRRAMTGEGPSHTNRPELVAEFGYDCKFAMHALRLGIQGIEYLQTGRISLPIPEPELRNLRAVRRGEWQLADVLQWCRELEADLTRLADTSPLPEQPDLAWVNDWLHRSYTAFWLAEKPGQTGAVLLILSTTMPQATDLGFLLHKHPDKAQSFSTSMGTAHIFWPEAGKERTTVEGKTWTDRDHGWHLGVADRLVAVAPTLIRETRRLAVDTTNDGSVEAGVTWWTELTATGGEGMVVKPFANLVKAQKGWAQPGIKVRGREYLRIIYGPDYTEPENLEPLRDRGLSHKRSMAAREYALGIESLERATRGEPLWRVHEAVFAVLALESEPVDPRL